MPSLVEGWLLMHWPYGAGQRQRHNLRWYNIYFGTRYGPGKLSFTLALKALRQ